MLWYLGNLGTTSCGFGQLGTFETAGTTGPVVPAVFVSVPPLPLTGVLVVPGIVSVQPPAIPAPGPLQKLWGTLLGLHGLSVPGQDDNRGLGLG